MRGDQAGFCMWIWELFYFLNHRAVTRYKPGNDILYLEGNKATGKKKTWHVVVYSAVLLVY